MTSNRVLKIKGSYIKYLYKIAKDVKGRTLQVSILKTVSKGCPDSVTKDTWFCITQNQLNNLKVLVGGRIRQDLLKR